mgnify:CR=1 FL=1
MKTTIRLFFASAFLLLAAGCCLTSPRYMCRSPTAQAWSLYWVLPMEMYWPLNGQTEEARWTDWKECGGREDGDFEPKNRNELTDKQYMSESKALFDELKGCMLKKSYQFVPQCHELEKCGPPPPAPNGGSWPAWASAVWPPESLGDRPPPRPFSPPQQEAP